MRVNRWGIPIVMLAVLFGSVGLGKTFGWWQTTGRKLTTIETVSPADIRGSSALGDLSDAFGIPMADLYQVLGIPSSFPPETQLKVLEEYNEVSVVRGLVAEHLGLPWEWDEDHDKPAETESSSEAESPAAADEHTGPAPLAEGEQLLPADIKGRMTLQEVSDGTGMPLAELYAAIGVPEDTDASSVLRDLKEQVAGFEVELVRQAVTAYQAQR